VRHRDIHLLTVGRYTYTTDQRLRAIHQPNSDDYALMIKYPQHRDQGVYECQVSTTPHLSHYIHLRVVGKFLSSPELRLSIHPIISTRTDDFKLMERGTEFRVNILEILD